MLKLRPSVVLLALAGALALGLCADAPAPAPPDDSGTFLTAGLDAAATKSDQRFSPAAPAQAAAAIVPLAAPRARAPAAAPADRRAPRLFLRNCALLC